jgi:hypothetical protein
MFRFLLLTFGLTSYQSNCYSQKTYSYKDKDYNYLVAVDSAFNKESGSSQCVVTSIKVLKDKKQIQVIKPDENSPYCDITKNELFVVEDVNFDGYKDLRLFQFLPAGPNIPYYFWIYNPKTGLYVRNKTLEGITSPEFDHKKKLIYSSWRSSCCDHGGSIYKYVNGKPTLIEESEQVEQNRKRTFTIKKLIHGKMKVVKREVEKIKPGEE